MRLKVEVNTHERSPALPTVRVPLTVESAWWSGSAEVKTFQLAELVSTKVRALYQRSKGRDLFDLWLALTHGGVDARDVLAAFDPYRPEQYTSRSAVANLEAKLNERAFRADLDTLMIRPPGGYDIDHAAALVIDQIFSRI
jgi:predicted nucleotidyltransferase component of viral defense system